MVKKQEDNLLLILAAIAILLFAYSSGNISTPELANGLSVSDSVGGGGLSPVEPSPLHTCDLRDVLDDEYVSLFSYVCEMRGGTWIFESTFVGCRGYYDEVYPIDCLSSEAEEGERLCLDCAASWYCSETDLYCKY